MNKLELLRAIRKHNHDHGEDSSLAKAKLDLLNATEPKALTEEHLVLVKVKTAFDFSPLEAQEVVAAILEKQSDDKVQFVALVIERET